MALLRGETRAGLQLEVLRACRANPTDKASVVGWEGDWNGEPMAHVPTLASPLDSPP